MIEIVQGNTLLCPNLGVGADCMIVDPPYAEHVHANAVSGGPAGAVSVKRHLGFDSVSAMLMRAIAGYAAQVRRWSIIFSDYYSTHLWRETCASAGAECVREIPWVRWSQPQKSGDRPTQGWETVMVFHGPRGKGERMRWNGPGTLTHFANAKEASGDRHPTAKPLDLLLDLVSWFSDPGELVIDPCGGDSTAALACRLLGRACLTIERSAPWVASGHERVHRVPQLRERDAERVRRYIEATCEEASRVPYPRKKSELRTWERAQRRLADVPQVAAILED